MMEDIKVKREELETSFEHILRTACRNLNPLHVLEWGPGRSTRMIAEECPGAKILSMEHDAAWIDRFNQDPLPQATLVHATLDMKGGTSQGYVGLPALVGEGKYDLIFIDGRYRIDCLVMASHLLKPGGLVILHDSHRKIYHQAFPMYKYYRTSEDMRTTVLSHHPINYEDKTWWAAMNRRETLLETSTLIENNIPFYHVRFGDGEIYCTEDPLFANKRHQPKDSRLSMELRDSLSIDHLSYNIACTMGGWNEGKLRGLRRILSKYFRKKTFRHVTFLHETFLEDFQAFQEFTELFQDRAVLLVGGPTVTNSPEVAKAFNVLSTVTLSDTNAYDLLDENMAKIILATGSHDIVLAAAGWASTVLAKRLWNQGIQDIQFLDIGSVVDALAGVNTRGWIKKNWEYVQEKRRYYE